MFDIFLDCYLGEHRAVAVCFVIFWVVMVEYIKWMIKKIPYGINWWLSSFEAEYIGVKSTLVAGLYYAILFVTTFPLINNTPTLTYSIPNIGDIHAFNLVLLSLLGVFASRKFEQCINRAIARKVLRQG